MAGIDSDYRDLIDFAERAGWKVDRTKKSHLRFTPPHGGPQIIGAGTAGDYRSFLNLVSLLRRAGLPYGREKREQPVSREPATASKVELEKLQNLRRALVVEIKLGGKVALSKPVSSILRTPTLRGGLGLHGSREELLVQLDAIISAWKP
jgi:hypothetical protein